LSPNLGALTSWNPLGPVQACNGTALPLPLYGQHYKGWSVLCVVDLT